MHAHSSSESARPPGATPAGGGREGALVLLPLALAALVYHPLPRVYFNADDFLNLYFIVNKSAGEYLLRPHGAHLLLTRNGVFLLFHTLFGPQPAPYFWSVLVTHLVNVGLLFSLIRRLTANPYLAAFGATLWGVCPVHVGTLGWYSVYGQVLVATLMLIILNQAVRATDARPVSSSAAVTWPLLLVLAGTCFGIGIGLTLVAPVVAFLLLPPSRERTRVCLSLVVLAAATPFLYRGALALFEEMYGPSAEGLAASIMLQRSEVSLHWLGMIGLLLTYGTAGLILGFYGQVGKFPPTAAWIVTGGFLVTVAIAWARASGSTRRQLLALGVMACGCYGMIAAGRSHFFQEGKLTIGAAQPRYHYVGSLAIAVVLSLTLAQLFHRRRRVIHAALLIGWTLLALLPFWRGEFSIDLFPNARKETRIILDTVSAKIVATPAGGDVYIRNQPFRAIGMLYLLNQVTFPGWAAIYTIFFPSNVVDGKHVYFTVDEPLVATVAKRGRRTADLIVLAEPSKTE